MLTESRWVFCAFYIERTYLNSVCQNNKHIIPNTGIHSGKSSTQTTSITVQ